MHNYMEVTEYENYCIVDIMHKYDADYFSYYYIDTMYIFVLHTYNDNFFFN